MTQDNAENEARELLPCPFCGGEANIERRGTPRQSTIYACTECGCRLETGEEWGHGRRWNTRAQPSPLSDDTVDRAHLLAEVGRLREALKPFVKMAGQINVDLGSYADAFKQAREVYYSALESKTHG